MDDESASIYRRVLSGFAWQGTAKFLVQGISWVSTIVVARILEPSDYGLMAIAGTFITLMMTLLDMGLAQGLVQRTTVTREEEDSVFWLSLLLGVAVFAILFLCAPLIAGFYKMPELSGILRLCAFGLVISSFKALPYALLMRRLDFRSRAMVEVVASLGSMATVITLALKGFGAWSLAWGALVQQTVVSFGFLSTMQRWPKWNFSISKVSAIISFGLHVTGANLAYVISSNAGVFVIGKFMGGHFTGIYSLAVQLATIPLDKIGTIFNQVAFPSLARVKDDDRQCRKLFLDLHRYLLLIAYPVLFLIAVVAHDLVAVLLGQKWVQVATILQVVCAVNLVRVSGMLISPLLNSRGRARDAFRYSLAGALILPPSFLIGVQFGMKGVVFAWVAAYPILYAMLLRYLRRDMGITFGDLVTGSRSTMIATILMTGAVFMFQQLTGSYHAGLRLLGSISVGLLAYIAVFIIFYGEHVAQMRKALRALRSGSSA